MSRLYDALRKIEEQGRETAVNSASTLTAPQKLADQPLVVPSVHARLGPDSRIVVYTDHRGPGAERFLLVRMTLRNLYAGKLPKVLLITSPLPQDGKSTIALNLATSLAEEGKVRVLLLEADLRRPALVRQLGLDMMPGVSEVLLDHLNPSTAIRRVEPLGFYLLSAGRLPENPAQLLQGERLSALLRELKSSFDWILVDSPPASPLSDVVALKDQVDSVLLVVRAGATPRDAVAETLQLFKPGQVAGMILNAADGLEQLYEYYYRYYGTKGPRHGSAE